MANDLVVFEPPVLSRAEKKAEQIKLILSLVATGRAVSRIIAEEPDMPSWVTFWNWCNEDEEVLNKLTRAREAGIEALLEKALHMAETPMEGEETTTTIGTAGSSRTVTRKDMLAHRRLYIDTVIKRAQMMKPKTYGAKADLTPVGDGLTRLAEAISAGNKRLENR